MSFQHTYAENLASISAPVKPMSLTGITLSLRNDALLESLQLPPWLADEDTLCQEIFGDNGQLQRQAIAQKYGGHQFGHWNPDLGDGRGLLLGEWQTPDGNCVDLHLKGAGKTPYSRFGDGRAVLRSTLREYLASEALHGLGIPTSRALCLFSSHHPVQRETLENGAMMIRVCQSHLRFGHFEYFYHSQQKDVLAQLFDFTLKQHFPHCLEADNPHKQLLTDITLSTAALVAKWQAYGFCHGVMNTDNMSIHGITFDYGPYGFLDTFKADHICNHSDNMGRYAYDQQPGVALWNLHALAHGFSDYVTEEEKQAVLAQYEPRLVACYSQLMQEKFGFASSDNQDAQLINEFMQQMEKEARDFTLSFRRLASITSEGTNQQFIGHFIDEAWASQWLSRYLQRVAQAPETDASRQARIRAKNPLYILRNHLAQQAIEAAEQGDFTSATRLLAVLSNPFTEQAGAEAYAAEPPDSAKGIALSCSS